MTAAPSSSHAGRLAQIDALRGFALLGILVVNIGFFASPYHGSGLLDPNFPHPVDRLADGLVAWLFETKFYLLFSFLFGYSFTLQMAAAERAGARFVPRFVRRLAGLALLGLAHAVLLFQGDILLTYALLGMLLLACRRLSARRALQGSLALMLLAGLAWTALAILGALYPAPPATPQDEAFLHAQAQSALQAYRGTIASTVAQHLQELTGWVWATVLLVQGPFAFAMFLAGYAFGRRQALADPWRHAGRLRAFCARGLPVGLGGAAIYAATSLTPALSGTPWEWAGLAVGLLSAPVLSASYACALLLALRARPESGMARWLAGAGRMALTNYLLQSAACAFLFKAWGLRWMGSVSPAGALLIALALFALQLPLSAWWLRGHAYGPVEWLLRAATTASVPPWRRSPAPC